MRLKPLTDVSVLHVSASMTRPDQLKTAEDLARFHRNQGYSKIACHYVIERDGSIVDGRQRKEPGVLAGKLNGCSYQVVLLGGVNDEMRPEHNFSDAQLESLAALCEEFAYLSVKYAQTFPKKD